MISPVDVLVWLLWIVLFVGFIAAAVFAVIHLRRRLGAPIWAVVLFVLACVVLPFFTVAIYWIVIGILRLVRGSTEGVERA